MVCASPAYRESLGNSLPRRQRRPGEAESDSDAWHEALHRCRHALGTGAVLALVGRRGNGKTKIAVRTAEEVAFRRAERVVAARLNGDRSVGAVSACVHYTTAMELFLDLRACMKADAPPERDVLKRYASYALLIIDEIQERGNTEWEDRQLVHLIDRRYRDERDTLLIGNLLPEKLKDNLGPSILSRIQEAGEVIVCDWPSFRTSGGTAGR